MQLTKHISQLLYRYDCVTVPGFGAFLGEPVSARLNETDQVIYPPSKKISFNSQLQSNDGLLANAVSQAEQVSYEQAVRSIHREVVRWKSLLHQGESLSLDRLGTVTLNTEKNTVFTPSEKHNHLKASFGLAPISAYKIDRKAVAQPNTAEPLPLPPPPEPSGILRYVAAAAVAFVIGYAGFYSYQDFSQDQLLAQEASLRLEAQNEVQNAVFDLGDLPVLKINPAVAEQQYHIIGGAFGVPSNAERYVRTLQSKGYPGAQQLSPNKRGLHPVSLGSFTDKKSAIAFLRQVQRGEIKDAWLFKL
jgi:hypothetical protein